MLSSDTPNLFNLKVTFTIVLTSRSGIFGIRTGRGNLEEDLNEIELYGNLY